MDENGGESQKLVDINTRRIVPVELNSYLCRNARIMKEFYNILGIANKEEQYEKYENDFKVQLMMHSKKLNYRKYQSNLFAVAALSSFSHYRKP